MRFLAIVVFVWWCFYLFAPKIQPIQSVEAMNLNYIYPQVPENIKNKPQFQASTVQIIKAIAILETNSGRAGVGLSRNNPVSIKCGSVYCTYKTLEEGYEAGYRLWERRYAGMNLDSALALWKTGNPADRSEATLAYIQKIYKSI